MKTQKTLLLTAGIAVASVSAAFALRETAPAVLPVLPAQPATAQVRVVEAQPFQLGAPLTHAYRAERPSYDSGWLLVLDAPANLLVARQTAEPVLYVGDETAERVNVGADSGRLVVIVPDLGVDGVDPLTAPIFFGDPALPEQVTREAAREQLAKARELNVAVEAGRSERLLEPIVLPDGYELHYYAATLVARHSPQEIDLIQGLQVPRIR